MKPIEYLTSWNLHDNTDKNQPLTSYNNIHHLTFCPLLCSQVSGSMAASLASPSTLSSSSRQYTRQRITRVNLRDLIFYMEQERETTHSLLLYRALLK